jgi:hypothetical protein
MSEMSASNRRLLLRMERHVNKYYRRYMKWAQDLGFRPPVFGFDYKLKAVIPVSVGIVRHIWETDPEGIKPADQELLDALRQDVPRGRFWMLAFAGDGTYCWRLGKRQQQKRR